MTNNPGNKLKDYLELSKLKIMIPVSLSGFTGYFILDSHFSYKLVFVSIGVLFMAVSSSVLNQVQEVEFDSRMSRTHNRPIPARKITIGHAIAYFIVCFITGIVILYSAGNIKAAIIGLITVFWYNVIYTYLKRITAFAVFPGAATGAFPPLIGWVAAGGSLWDKPIVFLGFLFFTGQIPHFWLLIIKYGEEYKNAGLPSLTNVFSVSQINRLTFTWVLFSVVAALFLCYFEIIQNILLIWVLLFASALLIWQFSNLIKIKDNNTENKKYSILLDSYFLLVLLLLISDRILT